MGKKDTVKLNAKKRNKGVISKKTKEQNRQGRKDAKANALLGNYKKKEIPDIPNLAPFKEKLDHRLKAMKLKEEKQQKRNEYFVEREKKQSMLDLLRDAEKRQRAFDVKEKTLDNAVDTNFEALPDSSKRAYYREFKKVVEASDVILEVLDARDPVGCRCKSVEQLILAKDPNKKIILVLNKIDLVPKSIVEKWLKHFRNEYPTIAFKCSTSMQRTNLGQSSVPVSSASNGLLNTSDCLGASTLVQLLKNYSRSINIKTAITVGIIGYPNVGKSSLINSLKRSKAVGVGAMPGFTKVMQEIQLDKKVKLLDCPGIVFASGDDDGSVLLRNCVKIENIPDPIRPIECIMKRCKTQQLMELYKLDPFYTPVEFLSQLARKRGKLKPGGIPDYVDSARLVLRDWNTGKIPYYTAPPEPDLSVVGDVAVVQGWAKEFNIDALLADDAETLKLLSNDMEGVQYLEVDSLSASDNNFSSNVNQFAQEIEMENDDDEDGDDDLPSNNNGNDDMVEELHPIEHKTKVVATKPVKLADSEDLFNPQRNRSQRKQQKKAKKLRKKGTDVNDNGNFEVSLDFSAMNFNDGGDDDDDDDVLLGI